MHNESVRKQLVAACFFAAAGLGLQTFAPGANSIGKALVQVKQG